MASPLLALIAAAALANGSAPVATRPADAAVKAVKLVSAKAAPAVGACVASDAKATLVRGRAVKVKCQANPQAAPLAAGASAGLLGGAGTTAVVGAVAAAGIVAGATYTAVDNNNTSASRG